MMTVHCVRRTKSNEEMVILKIVLRTSQLQHQKQVVTHNHWLSYEKMKSHHQMVNEPALERYLKQQNK
jgi:hypothetical protein